MVSSRSRSISRANRALADSRGPFGAMTLSTPRTLTPRRINGTTVGVSAALSARSQAVAPSRADALFDTVVHERKAKVEINGANHYYTGQPELTAWATDAVLDWLRDYGFPV